MAGELWTSAFQVGKETTPGTSVPATRKMYYDTAGSRLTRTQAARPRKFATGTRDNVRAFTLGPQVVGGTLVQPLSASEIVELLLMTIEGGMTPTGAGAAKLWTATPGTALDAQTVEWYDGARGWEAAGCHGNKLKITGNVRDDTIVTCELFGRSQVQATITPALGDRTPDFIEGWETKLYIDAFLGTPGATVVPGTLINWDVEIDNMLARKFWADNTNAAGGVVIGELGVKAKLLFEAAPAVALTEFNNWVAATKRLVRIEFGQNVVISGADKLFVTVDIPGAWEAVDLGGTDEGTRAYEMSLQYIYDTTNLFGLQIRAQNARTAAY
jgi:hypothetical protein